MQYAFFASATISIAPVTAITDPVLSANFFTNATASSRLSSVTRSAISASTPFVVPVPTTSVLISEIFPRITVNFTVFKSSLAVDVRSIDAPTPTGSSTAGCPSSLARAPAIFMDSMVRLFSVPILILRPAQIVWISATSSLSSAMIGEAPQARTMFAQSLTVT